MPVDIKNELNLVYENCCRRQQVYFDADQKAGGYRQLVSEIVNAVGKQV